MVADLQQKSNIIKIGCIFIVFFLIYSIAMIGKIYQNKSILKKEIADTIRKSGVDEERFVFNSLLARLEKRNLPITDRDLTVIKYDTEIYIQVIYKDTYSFFGVPLKDFRFDINQLYDYQE